DEDDRGVGAGRGDRVDHGVEDRDSLDVGTTLAGRHPGHDLRAVVPVAQGVEAALPAGEPLDDDPRVLVDDDRHQASPPFAPALASSTARPAASSMVAAGTSPSFGLAARMARPSSALVPSRRTTTGTFTSMVE